MSEVRPAATKVVAADPLKSDVVGWLTSELQTTAIKKSPAQEATPGTRLREGCVGYSTAPLLKTILARSFRHQDRSGIMAQTPQAI
jgi:hypothetical protein